MMSSVVGVDAGMDRGDKFHRGFFVLDQFPRSAVGCCVVAAALPWVAVSEALEAIPERADAGLSCGSRNEDRCAGTGVLEGQDCGEQLVADDGLDLLELIEPRHVGGERTVRTCLRSEHSESRAVVESDDFDDRRPGGCLASGGWLVGGWLLVDVGAEQGE